MTTGILVNFLVFDTSRDDWIMHEVTVLSILSMAPNKTRRVPKNKCLVKKLRKAVVGFLGFPLT